MSRLIVILALATTMCASGQSAPTRYVNLEKNSRGERGAVPFWASADAFKRCLQQSLGRLDSGAPARQAFERGACAEGRVADLTHGTAVEPMSSSAADCGALARVRVLDGDHKGKVGCLPPEVLSPQRVP